MVLESVVSNCYGNLEKLQDVDGGFFFGFDGCGRVNGGKFVRYNARVVELLGGSAAGWLINDSSWMFAECVGDWGLLVTALRKVGGYEESVDCVFSELQKVSLRQLKRVVPDRIFWVLESLDNQKLRDYVLGERRLRSSFFGVDYVCVSTVLYAIHYLTVKGCYEESLWWYRFLVDKFFCKSGEWKLSFFPFLNWVYRKAFSVHQLGMAPLYLLELYEATHEESILPVVKESVEFGLRFVRGDRVVREFGNYETRSYECAFDIVGLEKVLEHELVG